MSGRVHIDFTPGDGAVVRMLGLVERRGYALRRVTMEEHSGGASMIVDLEPRDSSRRVEVVARQLERLIDVNSVSVITPSSEP